MNEVSYSQISNGSFEIWDTTYTGTYSTELTSNFSVPDAFCGVANLWTQDYDFGVSRTTDSYSGNFSIILHNWYSYVYQSINYDDTINSSPLFLNGYFKYITGGPTGLSHGDAIITLTKSNGSANDTVAIGIFIFDSTATYTAFQIPLNYILPILPDSIHINLKNGNHSCLNANICNLLYLDNLELSNTPLGFGNSNSNVVLSTVYPNPAQDQFSIKINSTQIIHLELFNLIGEKLTEKYLSKNNSSIDISTYSAGIYFYKLSYKGQLLESGKLIKQ